MAQNRRDFIRLIEAALVGVFFVQAIRFLYSTLYAHLSSATLVTLTVDKASLAGQLGVVNVLDVQTELVVLGLALVAPLLSIVWGRLWFGVTLAAIGAAVGRVFMTAYAGTPLAVMGGAITAGAAGLYLTLLAVRHSGMMPLCLIYGFAGDQLVRLYGNTLDMTWAGDFLRPQTVLSLGLFVIAVIAAIVDRFTPIDSQVPPPKGEINGWGAFALGGLLYLQFVVLGLPNLIARRAGLDYVGVAPWLLGATLLPCVPEIRNIARNFLGMFDGRYRGWVWLLLIALLLVIGYRVQGTISAVMLIGTQFLACLSFWWVVQPSDGKRNFTGLGMIFGVLFFLLLTGGDFFTYEYAFVRGLQEPFGTLLRSFRGLGIAIALLAVLLACLPAIVARKRLPWRGGSALVTITALAVVIAGGLLATTLATPVVQDPPQNPKLLRIATLNLHGGYSLYFGSDLTTLGADLERHGVDVLLLQEVETGRLISGGVDQAAWLGRALRMQVIYFPTTDSLQGFAILSRLPIIQQDTLLLTSQSKQTGVQFARLRTQIGSQIDVYNTQLTLIFEGSVLPRQLLQEEQARQIREILAFMEANKSRGVPTALGGSLNQGPDENIPQGLKQRDQGFNDPFDANFFPVERAVTSRRINKPPERVDYLFLRDLSANFGNIIGISQSSHDMPVVEVGFN